jgi:hypothetical protein
MILSPDPNILVSGSFQICCKKQPRHPAFNCPAAEDSGKWGAAGDRSPPLPIFPSLSLSLGFKSTTGTAEGDYKEKQGGCQRNTAAGDATNLKSEPSNVQN